jgi:hypothetical protein
MSMIRSKLSPGRESPPASAHRRGALLNALFEYQFNTVKRITIVLLGGVAWLCALCLLIYLVHPAGAASAATQLSRFSLYGSLQ